MKPKQPLQRLAANVMRLQALLTEGGWFNAATALGNAAVEYFAAPNLQSRVNLIARVNPFLGEHFAAAKAILDQLDKEDEIEHDRFEADRRRRAGIPYYVGDPIGYVDDPTSSDGDRVAVYDVRVTRIESEISIEFDYELLDRYREPIEWSTISLRREQIGDHVASELDELRDMCRNEIIIRVLGANLGAAEADEQPADEADRRPWLPEPIGAGYYWLWQSAGSTSSGWMEPVRVDEDFGVHQIGAFGSYDASIYAGAWWLPIDDPALPSYFQVGGSPC